MTDNHQTVMNTSSSASLLGTAAPKSMVPPSVQSLLSLEYLKLPHPGSFLLNIQTGEVGTDILPIICNSPHTVKGTGGWGGRLHGGQSGELGGKHPAHFEGSRRGSVTENCHTWTWTRPSYLADWIRKQLTIGHYRRGFCGGETHCWCSTLI